MTQQNEARRRFLEQAIKPYATEIAECCVGHGGLAVVVHAPDASVRDVLRKHGWDGEKVWAMPETLRQALAYSDHVTGPWLERPWDEGDPLRIFLFSGSGTALLNFDPAAGWSVEPGSTDTSVIQ
jgi:hypothetical protein